MNNMVNARKLGLGGLALLAVSAAVGGCTEEEAIFGRAAMAGVSSHPRVVANPQASAWANAFSAGSQAQLSSINAKKMGTTVNVNVNGQNNTNVPRVYNSTNQLDNREITMFYIRTTNDITNNKTVYFEGEVLEEDNESFRVRVSSGEVYGLPKTQVVKHWRNNDPANRFYKGRISTFTIRTTNDITNNKTVPFEGEVLEEEDQRFIVRVSSGEVYGLPKTQVIEYWCCK